MRDVEPFALPCGCRSPRRQERAGRSFCSKWFGGDGARRSPDDDGLKKQKLIEKARSRSVHAVLGCAPVGTADIGSAPRLADFASDGRTNEEAVQMHALAMRDWMAVNMSSKRGLQEATAVRAPLAHVPAPGKALTDGPHAGVSLCVSVGK